MATLASPTISSHPTSPRPPPCSLPSFSPRSNSTTFAAFDDSFVHPPLLSPRPLPSSFSSSRSFNGSDHPLRFSFQESPSLKKNTRPTQIVNATTYANCTTEQKESVPDLLKIHVNSTCYSILNVPQSASPQEIRMAYRKLALQYHPDVSPLHQLDSATKLFSQINEAYATLSDPQKRKCYDLELAVKIAPTNGAVGYGSTRRYTNVANGRVYSSMNSFYREWKGTRNWETDQCWC